LRLRYSPYGCSAALLDATSGRSLRRLRHFSPLASHLEGEMQETVLVKTTLDGRRVEVIGGRVCLGGVPEADGLIVLDEHPNRQAILKAVPLATHMAGRLPLTMPEASVAQAALRRATETFDGSAACASERLRQAGWQKAIADGAE